MLTEEQFARLVKIFPLLRDANDEIIKAFQREAFYAQIPAGREIFFPGDEVNAIALLISGTVRVYKVSETGREITLYRFLSGESCILTANAILNNQSFSAIATVEEDSEAIMIPAHSFKKWMNKYELWRDFLYNLLAQRLSSVLEIVDEVAFGRMDARIAVFLLERSKEQNPLPITHQEIADELGSSREVISRILGSIANKGLIQLGRGTIEILDNDSLQQISLR